MASDAVAEVSNIIRRDPDVVVMGAKYSLGRAGTADPYSEAPFALMDSRGDFLESGYSLGSLWQEHFDKFLWKGGAFRRLASDKTLRDDLIRVAYANSGQLRENILSLLEKHAASGHYRPHAQVEEYAIYIWMTFAGYGRVHHLTGNAKKAEGLLQGLQQKLRKFTEASDRMAEQYENITPLYLEGGDVFVNPLHGSRDMIAYVRLRGRGDWGRDELDQVKLSLKEVGIRSLKPMPRQA